MDHTSGNWDIVRPYTLHPRRLGLDDPWRRAPAPAPRGFTLPELLVVILIISLISVVALPVVLPAYNHREVSAAGRALQGAIVGAQTRAAQLGRPAGIRLLPDASLGYIGGQYLPDGKTPNPYAGVPDPTQILAYSRIIPIEAAPNYQEGRVIPIPQPAVAAGITGNPTQISPGVVFGWSNAAPSLYASALILAECVADPETGTPNPPTSWFWNVRVGDKIQLGGAGPWYTVIGPTYVANSEQFVNVGQPGPIGGYAGAVPTINGQPVEFLVLVNGVDDNKDGFVDDGYDGIDNNGNGLVDLSDPQEWTPSLGGEQEAWLGAVATQAEINLPYTIRRRPAPSQNAREVALPSSMVVDATTWATSHERSRLPVNATTGYVDILINSDGSIVPTTTYSSPSSFGMDSAFFHFWLAERQDLAAPGAAGLPSGAPYVLPIAEPGTQSAALPGPYLKGEYSILSLSTRTGNVAVSQSPAFLFDDSIGYNSQTGTYSPNYPFIPAEQGAR